MKKLAVPVTFSRKVRPTPTKVFDTYWRFATERQRVFFARLDGAQGPWTKDPIIGHYKFTNTYRASDRVSQYLIKNVLYSKEWSLEDTVLRTLLFKIFNKIETWELLEQQFGEISSSTFNVEKFGVILERAMQFGGAIYSAAYIVPSGSGEKYKGVRKHLFHLQLLHSALANGLPKRLRECSSMEEAYKVLLNVDSFGKFLAYQFITDLNYSDHFNFSEMEFVVPGPGALDGIKKCFTSMGDYSEPEIIKLMAEEQEIHFHRLDCDFLSLWGRPLQLIDCQNIFCEVDKYARVAHPEISGLSGRTRIKQKFSPRSNMIGFWYPPKWGINRNLPKKDESSLSTSRLVFA